MSAAVADASVLFKTLVQETDSDQADAFVASSHVVVPELVYAEIGNAIWARVHDRRLTTEIAVDLIDAFTAAAFDVRSNRPHIRRAFAIAAAVGHPIYDCLYLALAESLDVPLVTADKRFLAAVRRPDLSNVEVIALAEIA
jgi:predicted nucleic acid-binding protein